MTIQAAPPPDTLTQHNVEQATGIPAAVFLAMVRRLGFPVPVAKIGNLRLVERRAFVTWLVRAATSTLASPRKSTKEGQPR